MKEKVRTNVIEKRQSKCRLTREQQEAYYRENLGLAYYVLNRYTNLYLIYNDEIEEVALYGLAKAVMTYNPQFDNKFDTYAVKVIENTVKTMITKINNEMRHRAFSLDEEIKTSSGRIKTRGEWIKVNPRFMDYDRFESKEKIVWLLNYVVNRLSITKALTFLYYIGGKKQYEIGNILGMTQAYISKMMQREILKIRLKQNVKISKYPVAKFSVDEYSYKLLMYVRKDKAEYLKYIASNCGLKTKYTQLQERMILEAYFSFKDEDFISLANLIKDVYQFLNK